MERERGSIVFSSRRFIAGLVLLVGLRARQGNDWGAGTRLSDWCGGCTASSSSCNINPTYMYLHVCSQSLMNSSNGHRDSMTPIEET